MDLNQASFLRHFARIRSTSSSGNRTEHQLGPSFTGRREWATGGADFSNSDSSSTSFHHPGGLIMDGSLPKNLISSANMRNISGSSSILSAGKGSEEGHSSSDSHQQNSRSSKVPKICGVCGDRAKSFHFGGLACDSCKAFFRRSVHNDAYTAFRCAYEGCCHITKNTRKGCQNCRFEKCLSIGMEKNWVMSEQERNIFNQQRMKKKKGDVTEGGGEEPSTTSNSALEYADGPRGGDDSHHRISQRKQKAYEPELGNMIQFMTDEDQTSIKKVVEDYRRAYMKIPYRVPHDTDGPRNSVQIIEMFTTILRRFAYFCKLVPEFKSLSKDDQGKLLRESVLGMCLLRGALSFDAQNHRWPNTNMEFLKDCPQLKFNDVENLVDPELHMMHMSFIQKMQKLKVDEPTMMLLLMVVLFYPDTVVSDQKAVMDAESKYLSLLEKYVHWRYGPKRGPRLFPHLLSKMIDLQHLNDVHTEFQLKLARDDVKVINEGLAKLKIDEKETSGTDSSPDVVFVRDTGSSDDDVQLLESPVSQSEASATAATATATNPEFASPIDTSRILEHTTGRPKNTTSPPPRSPRHLKERLLNADTQRSLHKRQCAKNPMAEVFLRRIPALIEDPFAPMVTESEILRFKDILMSGGASSSAGHFQLPPGFDPSSLLSRFPQHPSSPSETQTHAHPPPFTFPASRNEDLSPTHANLIAAAIPPVSHLGGFQIPSPMERQNVPTGSLRSISLPPHELEIARRIQNSLSPEKRAELRAMFFPNELIANLPSSSSSNIGNFGLGGLHLSPQHLQSLITGISPSTSSPMTSVAAGHHYGGGVSDADFNSSQSQHQSPMRLPMPSGGPPPVSPAALRNVQTSTVITSGFGTLTSSPSSYQVHPHLRIGDPPVKKPQFNWK